MTHNYNIIISNEFINMLYSSLSPLLYISPTYVHSIHKKILYRLKLLTRFPDMFSIFEIPINNIYYKKVVIEKRYLVIYSINFNIIYIHYFIDARRNPNNYIE